MATQHKDMVIVFRRRQDRRALKLALADKPRPDFVTPQRWSTWQRGQFKIVPVQFILKLYAHFGPGFMDKLATLALGKKAGK